MKSLDLCFGKVLLVSVKEETIAGRGTVRRLSVCEMMVSWTWAMMVNRKRRLRIIEWRDA